MDFTQKIDAYLKKLQTTIDQLDQEAINKVLNIW